MRGAALAAELANIVMAANAAVHFLNCLSMSFFLATAAPDHRSGECGALRTSDGRAPRLHSGKLLNIAEMALTSATEAGQIEALSAFHRRADIDENAVLQGRRHAQRRR